MIVKKTLMFLKHLRLAILLFIIAIINGFWAVKIHQRINSISRAEAFFEKQLREGQTLLGEIDKIKLKLLKKQHIKNKTNRFKNELEVEAYLLNYLNSIVEKHHAKLIGCKFKPLPITRQIERGTRYDKSSSLNITPLKTRQMMTIILETKFRGYNSLVKFLKNIFALKIKKRDIGQAFLVENKAGFGNIQKMRIQKSGMNLMVKLECTYYYNIEGE